MREIWVTYICIGVIFLISVAIGFIKSTKAILILGGLFTGVAIACGIFMRNYVLVNTVLDYVRTQGSSNLTTQSEWSNMQLLGAGTVVLLIVLAVLCFLVDTLTGSKSEMVYIVAALSFMVMFHLSDKRDIVASWNEVGSSVSSTQELYRLGDDARGIEYEFGVRNDDRSIDWHSISNPIDFKHIDSNWDWRVTKNGVTEEISKVWKTRVRYTDIETDNVSPFMKWLKTNDIELKVVKITRTEIKIVQSNKYYPNITQTFSRYMMDVQLEPVNPNWRTDFENWKSTVNELNRITKPKPSGEN